MRVYLRAKFEVFSIILTSFRLRVILPPPPAPPPLPYYLELNEKKMKITKPKHAFKGYASTYNIEILIFNTELQQC